MKKLIGSLVAVAGLAAAAQAEVNTRLAYEVSVNGGPWVAAADANPGSNIEVRMVVSYIGTLPVNGLAQVVAQPVVSSWTGADVLGTTAGTPGNNGVGPVGGSRSTPIGTVADAPGVWGRMTPFGANATTTTSFLRGHLGTGTAAGMLRIAQNQVTNWIGTGASTGTGASNNVNGAGGVSIAQIAPSSRLATDPAYLEQTQNIVVFKFGFTLGASSDPRTLVISTPANGIGRALSSGQYVDNTKWYRTNNSSNTDVEVGGVEVVDGAIRVVPTPASLALLGLGGLVAGRRRR